MQPETVRRSSRCPTVTAMALQRTATAATAWKGTSKKTVLLSTAGYRRSRPEGRLASPSSTIRTPILLCYDQHGRNGFRKCRESHRLERQHRRLQPNSANVARIDKTGREFFATTARSLALAGPGRGVLSGRCRRLLCTGRCSGNIPRIMRENTPQEHRRVFDARRRRVCDMAGVLLSYFSIDDDHSGRIPAGVVGVIPTKVSAENGPIQPGDLRVTASTPGHAMKAGSNSCWLDLLSARLWRRSAVQVQR